MPTAIRSESASPEAAEPAGEPARERGHPEEAQRDTEEHEPRAPECGRKSCLQVEGLCKRLDAEEREQPGRESHERREPHRSRLTQSGEPEQPERDWEDSDQEPDQRVPEESFDGGLRRLDRRGDLLHGLDPGGARHAHRDRLRLDPLERDDDRARAESAERRRAVDGVRDDGVVDVHVRNREVVALRVPDDDADLTRRELDAANVELDPPAAGSSRRDRRATSQPSPRRRRRARAAAPARPPTAAS